MTAKQTTEPPTIAEWPPTDPDVRDRLQELPPSAKLVARTLVEEGPLPQAIIADRSLLPKRTVRYGLDALEEADTLTTRPSLTDARKQVYAIQP